MIKPFDKIKPVFNIDYEMNNLLRTIELKLNQISITDKQKRKYMISKSRVRFIHSSLLIDANSLPLYAVENITFNKPVLGIMNEVHEVKNAIELYNHIDEYDYRSENDFLKAHQIMMEYFEDDNGGYRNHDERIKKEDKIIYMAPESTIFHF